MTKMQEELYNFIKKFIKNNGCSPTIREIAAIFQRSTGTIYPRLQVLRKKGFIDFEEHKARTIKILK